MTSYVLQLPGALKRAAVRVLNRVGLVTTNQLLNALTAASSTQRVFWTEHFKAEIKRLQSENDASLRAELEAYNDVVRLKRQLDAVDRFGLTRGFIAQL